MSMFIEYNRVSVIAILKKTSKVFLWTWIEGEKFLPVEERELSVL